MRGGNAYALSVVMQRLMQPGSRLPTGDGVKMQDFDTVFPSLSAEPPLLEGLFLNHEKESIVQLGKKRVCDVSGVADQGCHWLHRERVDYDAWRRLQKRALKIEG